MGIRGYSNIRLLLIDEVARVPDDLFRAVSPMLAVSDGRMICLSRRTAGAASFTTPRPVS